MRVRRLVASISAGFEDFVAQVENHEAVAQSAIDDVARAIAQLRISRRRAVNTLTEHERRLDEFEASEAQWTDRARSLGATDRAKALECLRRAKEFEARAARTRNDCEAQRVLCHQLDSDLDTLHARHGELERRKANLLARTARTNSASVRTGARTSRSIDDVFDRWEAGVIEDEIVGPSAEPPSEDALAREFTAAEEAARLDASLDALLKGADAGGRPAVD